MRTAEMLTGARGDLAIKMFGPDLKILSDLSGKIQATLQKVPGATEVSTVANDSVDYMQIEINRLISGRTGLSVTICRMNCVRCLKARPPDWLQKPGRRTKSWFAGRRRARST